MEAMADAPIDSAAWRELKYKHAALRARERYGVHLTRWAYWSLVHQIRNRDGRRAKRIAKVYPGVAWLVLHGDQWMLAVVCNGLIRTFLPLGAELPDEET